MNPDLAELSEDETTFQDKTPQPPTISSSGLEYASLLRPTHRGHPSRITNPACDPFQPSPAAAPPDNTASNEPPPTTDPPIFFAREPIHCLDFQPDLSDLRKSRNSDETAVTPLEKAPLVRE